MLVTGAAGLLGRAVLDALSGVRVTALDRVDPGDLPVDRVVVGDAGDPDVVRRALADVDAVIHLAAIPAPTLDTPLAVFGGNTRATFVVLHSAALAGVRRVVLASSMSVLGLAWAQVPLQPVYLPVDLRHPLQVTDPYALSKQADEATAAMVARRHGMAVTALRFPFLGGVERLARRSEEFRADPASGAQELWSYLHVDDAAAACLLGLTAPPAGSHVLFVAAPETLAPYPTEDLLAAFLPGVPLRARFPGRTVPVALEPARRLLGFTATRHLPLGSRSLIEEEPA
ncbi:NAD-dependent epimerase [Asanoa ishikariensis]|uniref:Nucleoside-diphosphate-sugar epimerase n=1 Tax=Asanoa ishikariensis TaxID=137265 RepID=A0A1H3T456_9ACTN|nr:NAD-dependent epimerase [Asanoa ishikariensis]SDZ44984.1 Nucleoside-diphosphate-sugar epimerase [Asanoa ishikariensis]